MAEKSKAEITEELRAEYRAAIQRTADLETEERKTRLGSRMAFEKSITKTYVIWMLLGQLGGHRFYLGRTLSGAAMLLLAIFAGISLVVPALSALSLLLGAVVLIWWLIDAFQIPKMLP